MLKITPLFGYTTGGSDYFPEVMNRVMNRLKAGTCALIAQPGPCTNRRMNQLLSQPYHLLLNAHPTTFLR